MTPLQIYTHCLLDIPLLQAVSDPTGKEDLIAALRRQLLLRVAAQLGCNKLAIGTSATRMAVRTVAMAAKGSGYALPGAIHFTDSRYAPFLHACYLSGTIFLVRVFSVILFTLDTQ